MKYFTALLIVFFAFTIGFAQNEQAPIEERSIDYKDWTYEGVNSDDDINLRKTAAGKKLVMVVYFAPWCPNWKHDAAFVQKLHEKYADKGLAVIGVGEYDTVKRMRSHLDEYKITFPTVYETQKTADRLTTSHYQYRTAAGDKRKWGSPWYVFLEPATIEKTGEIISKKPSVINGELIKGDADRYIRKKLGIDGEAARESQEKPHVQN